MSITDNVILTGMEVTNQSGNSRTVNITVASGQSRLVIMAVHTSGGAALTCQYDGGAALTPDAPGQANDGTWGTIWSVVNPTAGAHTVRFNSTNSAREVIFCIIEVAGDASSVLATASPTTSFSTSYTYSVTGTTTTSRVYAIAHRLGGTALAATSPLTERYQGQSTANVATAIFATRDGGSPNTSINFTAATSNRFGGAAVALEVASGGSPSNAPRSLINGFTPALINGGLIR